MTKKRDNRLFEMLNAITTTKADFLPEEIDASYSPFVINRFLSGSYDTIMYASDMNQLPGLPKDGQFHYLKNAIRSKKRYLKWIRPEESEDIEVVASYYKISPSKAYRALGLHTREQLDYMRERVSLGGSSDK